MGIKQSNPKARVPNNTPPGVGARTVIQNWSTPNSFSGWLSWIISAGSKKPSNLAAGFLGSYPQVLRNPAVRQMALWAHNRDSYKIRYMVLIYIYIHIYIYTYTHELCSQIL
jgi:hypothetical protein